MIICKLKIVVNFMLCDATYKLLKIFSCHIYYEHVHFKYHELA